MKHISFLLTTEQVRNYSKTVTRRKGWASLRKGERLQAVRKCMGLRRGEKVEKLAVIEVVSVTRERLDKMILFPSYGRDECRLEGFPEMSPEEFVAFFCRANRYSAPDRTVTRIQFRYVMEPAP